MKMFLVSLVVCVFVLRAQAQSSVTYTAFRVDASHADSSIGVLNWPLSTGSSSSGLGGIVLTRLPGGDLLNGLPFTNADGVPAIASDGHGGSWGWLIGRNSPSGVSDPINVPGDFPQIAIVDFSLAPFEPVTTIPEPSTVSVLILGLVVSGWTIRRRLLKA